MDQSNPGRMHGYIRVSTTDQAEEGYSLGDQEHQLRHAAQTNYRDRDFRLWIEAGVSGSIVLAERKEGRKMIEALHPGDIVIVCKLDRIFRSALDALTQVEQFSANQIGFILLDMGPMPISRDGAGQLQFTMLAGFAQFERNKLRERLRDSIEARRRQGRPLGGVIPMGFSVDENGFLIPNAHEEAILEEIRILHRQGYHPAGIARELLKRGMLSRKGKPIDKALIGHWLKKRLKTQQSVTADAPPSRSEAIKKGLLAKQRTEGWKPGNPRLGEAGKRGTATLKARCAARDQSIEPVITRIIETTGVTSYNGIAAALDAIPQPTVGGAKRWYPTSLRNIMRRLGIFSPHHPGKPRSVPDGEPSATFGPKPPAAPPLNTPLRRYSSMRRDHVVALYHEGVEPREIAVRLKFRNIKTVYRILHEANKPVGRTRAKTKEAEIVEQHAAGRPISEISEKTGIHPRSVYRLLAKRRQQNEAGEANTASFADQTLAVIWNLQGAGYLGDGTLAKQLNERGMPYKNGTQWTRDRVKRLLATGKSQEPDDLEQRKFVGFTIGLLPVINELHAAHCTAPQQIARALNFRHLRAFDGCPWQAAMVTAFLDRINWQPPEAKALPMTPPPPLQDDTDQANDEPVNLWAACQWAAEHVLPIVRELQALGFKTSAAIRYQIDQRGIRLPNGLPLTPDDVKRLVASTGASL